MPDQIRKIALVTGATRGIGRETARQLAAKDVHVLLAGRDRDKVRRVARELQGFEHNIEPCFLDVTNEESIASAAREISARHGRLDILINNAGIRVEEYGRHPSQQPLPQWRETFETNLFGVVAVTQALLPLLCKSEAGRIVNVSSLLASLTTQSNKASYVHSPHFKSLPAYSASKSAMNSWTIHLAYELRETPIKVNAVHPGYTRTDMNGGDGDLDVSAGARTSIAMALLGGDGPTGSYVHMGETLPW